MKLAILSDIHDHVWNLRAALSACQEADAMICCGDLCSPFIVSLLANGFAGPIHIVFGNNDGDQFRMTVNAAKYDGRVKVHGEFAILPRETFGRRIAINHYPAIAEGLAASGDFDLVCYGHDHKLRIGGTLRLLEQRQDLPPRTAIVNPGAIMGYDPVADSDITPTFITIDTQAKSGVVYDVHGGKAVPARSVKPWAQQP